MSVHPILVNAVSQEHLEAISANSLRLKDELIRFWWSNVKFAV